MSKMPMQRCACPVVAVAFLLSALIALGGCSNEGGSRSRTLVEKLPDAAQEAIAESRGMEPAELTDAALKGVTWLELTDPDLQVLPGLQGLPHLEDLTLDGVGMRSLNSMDQLPQLRILWIRGKSLKSLDGIEGLTELEELNLVNTSVHSLEPLRSLQKLESIHIKDTPIADLRPIAQLPHLKELALGSTNVKPQDPVLQDLRSRCAVLFTE